MGSTLHYLIKQIDIFIDRRRCDLADKRPGALPPFTTKIIWVRMLKRSSQDKPKNITQLPDDLKYLQATHNLRGKFNSIMEERLFDGKDDDHRIISIDVQHRYFDITGNLTSAGKEDFWKEINKGFKKFDLNEIKLLPRRPIQHLHNENQSLDPNRNVRVLPTPPGHHVSDDRKRKSKSRSPPKSKNRTSDSRYKRRHERKHSSERYEKRRRT